MCVYTNMTAFLKVFDATNLIALSTAEAEQFAREGQVMFDERGLKFVNEILSGEISRGAPKVKSE
jgi:hypothetical protein